MFEKTFNSADSETKIEFLKALLDKNPGFQQQFLAFYHDKHDKGSDSSDSLEDFIVDNFQMWKDELEALDFNEPDWEDYVPRHSGYIPEYEAIEHLAEDMVEYLLDQYEAGLLGYTHKGQPVKAFLFAIAGLDACIFTNLNDEYDALGGDNSFLIKTLGEKLNKLRDALNAMVVSEGQLQQMAGTLFQHFNKLEDAPANYLRLFEPILLILVENENEASAIRSIMNENSIDQELLPLLTLKLQKLGQNPKGWEQTARQLIMADQQVAHELLQHDLQNNPSQFVETAKRVWENEEYRYEFGEFLFDQLLPAESDGLYKTVAIYLTERYGTERYYRSLRQELTDTEREAFRKKHKNWEKFYVMMLYVDENYTELLQFVQKNYDSFQFIDMLDYLIKIYPKESIRLIRAHIHKRLETERGRPVYSQMVKLVKKVSGIKDTGEDVRMLVQELFARYARLPAFCDEMKQAGFGMGR